MMPTRGLTGGPLEVMKRGVNLNLQYRRGVTKMFFYYPNIPLFWSGPPKLTPIIPEWYPHPIMQNFFDR